MHRIGFAVVVALAVGLAGASFGDREALAQTAGFVLEDTSAPDPARIAERMACYGFDGSSQAVYDGVTAPIGYQRFDARTVLQGTLPNDGIVLNYATRKMHLIERAQAWHGFVWMDANRDGLFAWELVTYPAAMCSYYPDPAREAVEGHYWIDSVH